MSWGFLASGLLGCAALAACNSVDGQRVDDGSTGGMSDTGGATTTTPSGGAQTSGGTSSGGQIGSGGTVATGGSTSAGAGGSSGGAPSGGAPAGGASSAGAGGKAGSSNGKVRILPLGDSITANTCYRAQLWKQLNQSFPGRFDFVGSAISDDGCNVPGYDMDNEGHGGCLSTDIVNDIPNSNTAYCQNYSFTGQLGPAIAAHPADVVLLHFATNDIWNGRSSAQITAAYSKLVDAVRAANPNVIVIVAKIIPLDASQCGNCGATVPPLNTAIETWAGTKSTAASPLIVVDQFTGFDSRPNSGNVAGMGDTKDGIHPNASGSLKMATKWYGALAPLF